MEYIHNRNELNNWLVLEKGIEEVDYLIPTLLKVAKNRAGIPLGKFCLLYNKNIKGYDKDTLMIEQESDLNKDDMGNNIIHMSKETKNKATKIFNDIV